MNIAQSILAASSNAAVGGTLGRVYGGDPALVHVPDGQRRDVGEVAAYFAANAIRTAAKRAGKPSEGPICPGCYQIVIFNAAVALAKANGQSLVELGRTLGHAFLKLAEDPVTYGKGIEEIKVIKDEDPMPTPHDEDDETFRRAFW